EQTGTGRVKGTPRYMAPEQAAGLSDRIDGRTDVYALGAILFTVLTGQSPHDRFKNCGRDEYLQKISSGGLPRAREVRADAPLALDAVCAKAMATEPDDRYGTALDLANDVRQWLRGEPTSAYREPWLQRLRRKAAHHRRLTVTGAAALLTLVVAYTAFSVQSWAETNTLVELTMRDLSTRSDMLRNDILIHLRHLQITCKSTSQDPLVQDFVQKDAQAANPGPQGQRVESLFTTYLQLVVLCRSLSIADGSADGQEVLRVLRHGSGDPAHTALPAELRKLGRMSDYRWLFEAGGGSSYRARFCRGDSGDPGMILVIATAIDQPGQRYWLIVEYDYTTWLTLLLDPFANHRIEAFVRDEAGQLLVAAGTLHADCLFGDRRASGDARLVQFLSTPGPVGPAAPDGPDQFLQGVPPTDPRNILALPDCGAHRDLVFASKIHYSKDDPKAYLGLILLKHPDDFLEYRRASSLVLFGSWLLIFAAVMVMVVIAARLFTRREPWQS
ncbi:MAG: serine/threonine protein kinase, partial [Gemmataceae bacterium]